MKTVANKKGTENCTSHQLVVTVHRVSPFYSLFGLLLEIEFRALWFLDKERIFFENRILLDVAKRAGRVGFGSGQSGLRVKRVTGQNWSFLNGSTGLRVGSG